MLSLALAGCQLVFPFRGPPSDARVCSDPMGHNEDGDDKPDDCDPCPGDAAREADIDDDGNGIGAGCEPSRQLKRLAFEGFGDDLGRFVTGGAWVFTNDDLVQPDSTSNHVTLTQAQQVVEAATVAARIDLTQPGSFVELDIGSDNSIALSPMRGTGCRLANVVGSYRIQIVSFTDQGPQQVADGPYNVGAPSEVVIRLDYLASDAMVRCHIDGVSPTGVGDVISPRDRDAFPLGHIRLLTGKAFMAAHWIDEFGPE